MCICTHITTNTSQGLSMVDVYTTGRNCCWELLCVSARWQYKSQLFYTGESIVWGGRSLYSMFHYRYNKHTSYNIQKTDVGGMPTIDRSSSWLLGWFHFFVSPLSFSFVRPDDPSSRTDQQRIFSFSPVFFLFCITLERKKKKNKQIKRLRERRRRKKTHLKWTTEDDTDWYTVTRPNVGSSPLTMTIVTFFFFFWMCPPSDKKKER